MRTPLSERFYSLLLFLYPRQFRHAFGRDMEELFRDRLRTHRARQQPELRFWRRVILDLLRSSGAVHAENIGNRLHQRPDYDPSRNRGSRHTALSLTSGLGADFRAAIRSMTRNPLSTIVILATLSLGVGANIAIFRVVDRVLITPPTGIHDVQEVARAQFALSDNGRDIVNETTSYPTFRALRESGVFESVAAQRLEEVVFVHRETVKPVNVLKVSGEYFPLLGTIPHVGGLFDSAADNTRVAVVSYSFWMQELGGTPEAVGASFRLDGIPYTAVGVAPAGFAGAGIDRVDVWIPILGGMPGHPPGWHLEQRRLVVSLVVRSAPGDDLQTGSQKATQAIQGVGSSRGERLRVALAPLQPGRNANATNPIGRLAFWLAGVAALVLLVAILNVLGLELLRALRSQRAAAMKIALGISRFRLIRSLLIETLLVSLLGAAVGVVFAGWMAADVGQLLIPGMSVARFTLDPITILITLGVALCASGLSSSIRYGQANHPTSLGQLRSGGFAATFRRSWLQRVLITTQVALAVVLLAGAGLFVSSLSHVLGEDLGLETEKVLVVNLKFEDSESSDSSDARYRELSRDLLQLPLILQTAYVQAIPFGPRVVPPFSVPGRRNEDFLPGGQLPYLYPTSDGLFEVLGLEILEGRGFGEDGGQRTEFTAIVNQSLARAAWPRESPLGKCLRVGMEQGAAPSMQAPESLPCRRVIGVVNDSRLQRVRVEDEPTTLQYYLPYDQVDDLMPGLQIPVWGLLLRVSDVSEKARARVLQEILARVPEAIFADIRPYEDLVDRHVRTIRLGAGIFSLFGTLALALAAFGLYGAVAYSVRQRRQEMGIRIALGARLRNILGLIVGEGLRVALLGCAVGGLAALVGVGWIQEHLYETSPQSPEILGLAILTLILTTSVACLVPGWRASRVDPGQTLRNE